MRATAAGLLALAACIALGAAGGAYAQDDPAVLLQLAQRAQERLSTQISPDSPDEARALFERGSDHVRSLEDSIREDDLAGAQGHFSAAMQAFKQLFKQLNAGTSQNDAGADATADLQRLSAHVQNLKMIAAGSGAPADFAEIDGLLDAASRQVADGRHDAAYQTIGAIRDMASEIGRDLHRHASHHESERAAKYAQRYLGHLDRLIEHARGQGLPDGVIERLEQARTGLSSASGPDEIRAEIKKIKAVKDQFQLTKNDGLESKVLRAEKAIHKLSQRDGASQTDIDGATGALEEIKRRIAQGQSEEAGKLMEELRDRLRAIRDSVRP